ncbi:hypothetical protein HN018_03340 [Lichenicola cladoniae]|uniref:Uncharacterized protein n=1 Tax=Lichenicola cladoniae TaxID=1484109 RepID=A0A6M8HLJ3_9PROT|nr:hypothetical protein [Lichenicola cladoniae]NPD70461.1 hypothetical protein [Acetobacteraceae bacterium]QKE89205.1 hypothetical protein HN018_03340 [Lichenicola cladoniae]
MRIMLDHDLEELTGRVGDVPPPGLEQAIWCRIEVLQQSRRIEVLATRLQALALVIVLGASTTIGVALARARPSPLSMIQISSEAAGLAPSTLLGFQF